MSDQGVIDKTKETLGNAWDATKEKASDLKEAVVGKSENAGDKASDAWDKTKDKARDLKEDAYEKKGELKEKFKS